jgi:hypothetical protein
MTAAGSAHGSPDQNREACRRFLGGLTNNARAIDVADVNAETLLCRAVVIMVAGAAGVTQTEN